MEALPEALAAQIAAQLADERDLASLRATSRSWRTILADPSLWRLLLQRRFWPSAAAAATAAAAAGGAGGGGSASASASDGDSSSDDGSDGESDGDSGSDVDSGSDSGASSPSAAGAPAVAAAPGGAAAAAALGPELLFRQLASLHRPATQLDRVVWLDGHHLQEVREPGSTTGRAIRVHSVFWLELATRFQGVLPGRYCAAWRIRLQGSFNFSGGRLIARHLPSTSAAAAAGLAAGREDPLLPILKEDGVRGQLWQNAVGEPPEARTTLTLVTRQQLDQAFQQEGSGWFELKGGPFEVHQLSSVYVKFHSPQGFSSGVVFDSARLERL